MPDAVLAKLAALKTTPTPKLKGQWRKLFDTEPPPYNRRFLEHRLYRIQELAHGKLKPETIERFEALAEDLDGGVGTINLFPIGHLLLLHGARNAAPGSVPLDVQRRIACSSQPTGPKIAPE